VKIHIKDCKYSIADVIHKNLVKAKYAVAKYNTSTVFVVDGKSGSGKTTLSFQMALFLDNDFSLDKVAWDPKKFIELIDKSKAGDCIVFDESMVINSRSAMSQANKLIMIAMSQMRSRNIFVIFNINSIFDLDRNLSLHRTNSLFHVYQAGDKIDGQRRVLLFDRKRLKILYILGKKFYSYSKPKANASTTFTKFFPFDDAVYENRKRKESGVNMLMNSERLGKNEKKYKLIAAKIISYLRAHDIKHKDVSRYTKIDEPTLSRTLSWAKDNKYIEDGDEGLNIS